MFEGYSSQIKITRGEVSLAHLFPLQRSCDSCNTHVHVDTHISAIHKIFTDVFKYVQIVHATLQMHTDASTYPAVKGATEPRVCKSDRS